MSENSQPGSRKPKTTSIEFDGNHCILDRRATAAIDRHANSIIENRTVRIFAATALKLEGIARLAVLNPTAEMGDLNALHIHLTFQRLPEEIKEAVQEEFACPVRLPAQPAKSAEGR